MYTSLILSASVDMDDGRGVPVTVRVFGAAVVASALSHLNFRWGRRRTFVLGMVFATVGAATSAFALWAESFLLLLLGRFVIGPVRAANQRAHFAAGDMHADDRRASAISLIVWVTTIGSVIGPRLIGRSVAVAESLGANELAGPFMMAVIGFTVAAVYYAITLRPDPMEPAVARSGVGSSAERRPLRELVGAPQSNELLQRWWRPKL